jgi:hypothetical protein
VWWQGVGNRNEQRPVMVVHLWSIDVAGQHHEVVTQHEDLEMPVRPDRTAPTGRLLERSQPGRPKE